MVVNFWFFFTKKKKPQSKEIELKIANEEKTLPKNFISEDGFRITKAGIDYLQPLIQGESFPKFSGGVPVYEGIDLHLNKI